MQATKTMAKKTSKKLIHTAVSLGLMLLFRFIPPIPPLTSYGMTIIGVFAGAIYGWIACDVIWPSFACLLVLGTTTITYPNVTQAFLAVGSNTSVLNIMVVQFVVTIVLTSGAGEWLGRWFISRPAIKGRPLLMIGMIFLAGLVVGPFAGMAWMLLMWNLIDVINTQLGYERKSRFSQLLLYCLLFNTQQTIFLMHQQPIITSTGLFKAYLPDFAFEAYPFVLFGLISSICLIVASFIGIKLVFKLDLSGFKNPEVIANFKEPEPMTKKQKIVSIMMLCYVALQIIPSVLPGAWAVTAFLKKFGVIGLSLLFTVIALIVQVDGKPITTFREIQSKSNWSIMFMPAVAMIIATALTSEDTGVLTLLADTLGPIFSGFSPYIFTLVVAVVSILFTNVINNIVVISLFLPIVFSVGPAVGVSIPAILPIVMYSAYLAVALPSSNPVASVLHANTDQVETKEIIKFSGVSIVTSIIVYALVLIPLANFFYA